MRGLTVLRHYALSISGVRTSRAVHPVRFTHDGAKKNLHTKGKASNTVKYGAYAMLVIFVAHYALDYSHRSK